DSPLADKALLMTGVLISEFEGYIDQNKALSPEEKKHILNDLEKDYERLERGLEIHQNDATTYKESFKKILETINHAKATMLRSQDKTSQLDRATSAPYSLELPFLLEQKKIDTQKVSTAQGLTPEDFKDESLKLDKVVSRMDELIEKQMFS